MDFASFFDMYFVAPVLAGDVAYNVYNTFVYAAIFAGAVVGVFKLLQKLEIKIDRTFFIANLPFIILATVFRALRDAGTLTSPVFVSPLIYIFAFVIALAALLMGVMLERKKITSYRNTMLGTGGVLLVVFGAKMGVSSLIPVAQILLVTGIFAALLYFVNRQWPEVLTQANLLILIAAMFDAASTFVGVEYYGYVEKHIIPNFLFGLAGGPWIMLPLKLFVVFFALYAIDHIDEDNAFKNFIKFAILCITLGPGARNTLRMMMGV